MTGEAQPQDLTCELAKEGYQHLLSRLPLRSCQRWSRFGPGRKGGEHGS